GREVHVSADHLADVGMSAQHVHERVCGHYSIEPVLESRSGPVPGGPVPCREGPGELAVVLCDDGSTVVHMERFLDRHLVLAPDLFTWSPREA
ncbi:MAG: hypothetical protein AAF192_19360, partial [Pseudomonadota bacterium]